jgi:hypothetical protein
VSWLRHNRWWLPLLPVCLAVMLVASGYRVRPLWYDAGLHRVEASGRPGQTVSATDDYDDAFGGTSRAFTVRLTAVRTQRRMPGFDGPNKGDPPPAGAQAVAADLAWSAEPDQSLVSCTVALVDTEGRRYEVPRASLQTSLCVPDDHGGPDPPLTRAHPRGYVEPGSERPTTWQTTVVFAVPKDVVVAEVLIWWNEPSYVELAAP